MAYDYSKQFMDSNAMDDYRSIDLEVAKRYGDMVKAIELSNREYQHRFDKLSSTRKMQPPPSNDRIFLGYLVVRNLGKSTQYETWMPSHVFEEIYQPWG